MDIGIIMGPRVHPDHPYPLADVYQDYLDDIVRAEQYGFDNAWIGEHRMTRDLWTPSPLTMLANVAARTSAIRIGTSVLCLPFHHPLRVAEDITAVDILSRGRFNFGFGAGSQWEEFRSFGIESRDRMSRTYESAAFIRRALTTEGEFSWEGKYYTIPNVNFTSKPVQKDMPFFAAAIGPASVRKAAEYGYHLISEARPAWQDGMKAAGHDASSRKAQMLLPIVVGQSADEAWEIGGEGVLAHLNFYALRRQLDGSLPDPATATLTKQDVMDRKMAVLGSPDEVLQQVTEYFESLKPAGQTGLAFQMRNPGMATTAVEKSMRLFHEHVQPELLKL